MRVATLDVLLTLTDQASAGLQKATGFVKEHRMALVGLGAAGAVAMAGIKKAVSAAAEFEQTTIAFTTMLGSAEKAANLLNELAQFAATTPFELREVEAGAKALMAFGVAEKQILPDLKALGDVSAGLSVPIERLILNFGQVKAQSKLTGREIRDFAIAGVPILDELAKMLGKSVAEIQEMSSAGEITFPMVRDVFTQMTSEGGRFANLMDKQSKSFAGMMSNMRDQINLFLREGGKPFLDTGKNLAASLTDLVTRLNEWAKVNPDLIAKIGKVVVAVSGLAIGLGSVALAMPILTGLASLFTGIVGAAALAASGILPIVIILGTVGVAIKILDKLVQAVFGKSIIPTFEQFSTFVDWIGREVIGKVFVKVIKNSLMAVAKVIQEVFSLMSAGVYEFAKILNKTGRISDETFNDIESKHFLFVSNMVQGYGNLENKLNELDNTIQETFAEGDLLQRFKETLGDVSDEVKDLVAELLGLGRDAGNNFVNGVNAAVDAAMNETARNLSDYATFKGNKVFAGVMQPTETFAGGPFYRKLRPEERQLYASEYAALQEREATGETLSERDLSRLENLTIYIDGVKIRDDDIRRESKR